MSRITAIMPCRNSGWILGLGARVLMQYCDSIVLLDHASTDNTPAIIQQLREEFPSRVCSIRKDDAVWAEMSHRDTLLNIARECFSPTHLCITDDDELPSGNILPQMRQLIESTPRGSVLQLPWVQLKGSIHTYIASGLWSQQVASTAFPDDPAYCWKPQAGEYQHHHRHPMGKPIHQYMPLGNKVAKGGVMHLQMASDKRLKWKQYAYQLSERLRWPDRKTAAEVAAMYSPTVESPGVLSSVPESWWAPYSHLMKYLDVDAEPWQMDQCRQMIRENPGIEVGLNNFGLVL